MDSAIWATWYDLPEEGANEYIAWLHEVHLPEMLERSGYLWAAHVDNDKSEERAQNVNRRLTHTDDPAVPAGNGYLMLFGAESVHTFLDPSPAQLAENRGPDEREMLGLRAGVRECVFVETGRIDGPEIARRAPGITPGPRIQMGSFNINALENEEGMGAWYVQLRFPRMQTLEGCVGMRKLVSVCGWAKHAVLYEFDLNTSVEHYFQKELESEAWSREMVGSLVHAPGSPSTGKRIWPPVDSP